jgi:hypothetical protein
MMIKQDWMNFKLENYTDLRMKVAKSMTVNKMDEFDEPNNTNSWMMVDNMDEIDKLTKLYG